jgi:hypothetical protein
MYPQSHETGNAVYTLASRAAAPMPTQSEEVSANTVRSWEIKVYDMSDEATQLRCRHGQTSPTSPISPSINTLRWTELRKHNKPHCGIPNATSSVPCHPASQAGLSQQVCQAFFVLSKVGFWIYHGNDLSRWVFLLVNLLLGHRIQTLNTSLRKHNGLAPFRRLLSSRCG